MKSLLVSTSLAAVLVISACAQYSSFAPETGNYVTPIGGSPVTQNPTPYSRALQCIGTYGQRATSGEPIRIAVGNILDYTGKTEGVAGAKITQGASLMAMSAFSKAGAVLIERYDSSIIDAELIYANNKLIGDDSSNYRKIAAGSIMGSDYHLLGGITELNYNIGSHGAELFGGGIGTRDSKGMFNYRQYVLNVGLDLRLVDTRTSQVVKVISYQKQIIGREISAGTFAFFDDNIIDVGIGGKSLEPIQLAVRTLIERAALEIMANRYGLGDPEQVCNFSDPLGQPFSRSRSASYPAPVARPALLPAAQVRASQPAPAARSSYRRRMTWDQKRDVQNPATGYPAQAVSSYPATPGYPAASAPAANGPSSSFVDQYESQGQDVYWSTGPVSSVPDPVAKPGWQDQLQAAPGQASYWQPVPRQQLGNQRAQPKLPPLPNTGLRTEAR
jgi:curli biogenesis system outer membrane secretion channel CsgG